MLNAKMWRIQKQAERWKESQDVECFDREDAQTRTNFYQWRSNGCQFWKCHSPQKFLRFKRPIEPAAYRLCLTRVKRFFLWLLEGEWVSCPWPSTGADDPLLFSWGGDEALLGVALAPVCLSSWNCSKWGFKGRRTPPNSLHDAEVSGSLSCTWEQRGPSINPRGRLPPL